MEKDFELYRCPNCGRLSEEEGYCCQACHDEDYKANHVHDYERE